MPFGFAQGQTKSRLKFSADFVTGSGGGIRTPDLLVMHTNYGFRRLRQNRNLWSGLYIHPFAKREGGCLPSSLYTFPLIGGFGSGLSGDERTDFPEFDR